eukprot:GFYU01003957.1.p1 GENE.GFYU01003957.1~~GFYU01003957.1.p1  ORF type:complete len:335 (-),score=52.34 GFYU01003957.1:118-1122(-)
MYTTTSAPAMVSADNVFPPTFRPQTAITTTLDAVTWTLSDSRTRQVTPLALVDIEDVEGPVNIQVAELSPTPRAVHAATTGGMIIIHRRDHPPLRVMVSDLCANVEEISQLLAQLFAKWVHARGRLPPEPRVQSSQLGQDTWVLETLKAKTGGYFVDIGAGDGVLINNTHRLEVQYGWTGIAVEPSRQFDALQRNRQCVCVKECLSDVVETVTFLEDYEHGEHNQFSGIQKYFDAHQVAGQTVEMRTKPLVDVLREHGAPHVIDFLSIDTEGSELVILSQFPFDQYRFHTIAVEHNYAEPKRTQMLALLKRHGYERVVCAQWDDWFAHSSVLGQ